jgi:hypothetical protein
MLPFIIKCFLGYKPLCNIRKLKKKSSYGTLDKYTLQRVNILKHSFLFLIAFHDTELVSTRLWGKKLKNLPNVLCSIKPLIVGLIEIKPLLAPYCNKAHSPLGFTIQFSYLRFVLLRWSIVWHLFYYIWLLPIPSLESKNKSHLKLLL